MWFLILAEWVFLLVRGWRRTGSNTWRPPKTYPYRDKSPYVRRHAVNAEVNAYYYARMRCATSSRRLVPRIRWESGEDGNVICVDVGQDRLGLWWGRVVEPGVDDHIVGPYGSRSDAVYAAESESPTVTRIRSILGE